MATLPPRADASTGRFLFHRSWTSCPARLSSSPSSEAGGGGTICCAETGWDGSVGCGTDFDPGQNSAVAMITVAVAAAPAAAAEVVQVNVKRFFFWTGCSEIWLSRAGAAAVAAASELPPA